LLSVIRHERGGHRMLNSWARFFANAAMTSSGVQQQ
jgi:hypothetical protein